VVAAKTLRDQTHLPVVAIEPAIKPAVALTRSGVVGVLATRQTVQSASVARLVDLYGADKRILLQGCPGLVEQVERADLHSVETEALLRQYVAPVLAQGADILVLGCTHYPLMQKVFQDALGPNVKVFSQANLVAESLADYLSRRPEMLGSGQMSKFLTTGDPASVSSKATQFMRKSVRFEAAYA
jgi:glutamate racemase